MSEYAGQTDTELEARFADLYQQIMAGFDSLPRATWTVEYQAAIREIRILEVEFRHIGVELARRLDERTERWNAFEVAVRSADRELSNETPLAGHDNG